MNWPGSWSAVNRLIALAILVAGFFFWPWWFSLALAVFAAAVINRFYEAVVVGFLLDVIFGFPDAGPLQVGLPFTILLFIIVSIVPSVKGWLFFRRG